MPNISIITATYNVSYTLISCLQSVASQTLLPEHLIIDGGSEDQTLQQARAYSGHHLKIISEADDGMYDAMNKGIKIADGEIVGILNADDFYASPDVLEMVSCAFEDPEIGACYGDLLYVDRNDTTKISRYWRSGDMGPKGFHWGWMPPHPTFFVRSSVYAKYGAFNLELGTAADYELMLRFLVKQQIRVKYIPEILVKMRTGGASNAALTSRIAAHRLDRRAWEVNGLRPYPWTLWMKPLRKLGQWVTRPQGG